MGDHQVFRGIFFFFHALPASTSHSLAALFFFSLPASLAAAVALVGVFSGHVISQKELSAPWRALFVVHNLV